MSIGSNIKKLRLKHGLEQSQLGEIAGVTDKAVSSWENGNSVPRMGAIEKMAQYFGIRKSDIIDDTESTSSYSSDIELDNFTYALYNETKNLSDEQKNALLAMARILNGSV